MRFFCQNEAQSVFRRRCCCSEKLKLTFLVTFPCRKVKLMSQKKLVEDILVENIIGQNWENYWSKTIDRKDSWNSRYLTKVKHISRNILVKFACILHPNTFPEKANPFFLMIF